MRGQWIGDYSGTNTGTITANIDELEDHFEGHVNLHVNGLPGAPITVAKIKTGDKGPAGAISVENFLHLDPLRHTLLSKDELTQRYPGLIFPDAGTAHYEMDGELLNVDWTTAIGTTGHASIISSKATKPSELDVPTMSWAEFKRFADIQPYRKVVFRGQEQPWRLRTAFHRSNRFDLLRFVEEDMPRLYNALAGRTRHFYNQALPHENASFLHLAQHHGYPTPLLDWTFSPYVAAFCAFRKVNRFLGPDSKVRIFIFDLTQWKVWQPVFQLVSPTLHISVLEILIIDNDRAGPQQALSLLTNLDDPESYIRAKEVSSGKTYLTAVDIPASERNIAMVDLARMGISAGSMFPGLDGACEELKERMFPT